MKLDTAIEKMVFVFGSNESGHHGAGAALYAKKQRGAINGMGFGPMGTSFAVPTKDWRITTLTPQIINFYVQRFLRYAAIHMHENFQVTQLGCGLAGLHPAQIAPMFNIATTNCLFDTEWHKYLGDDFQYWGTFGA